MKRRLRLVRRQINGIDSPIPVVTLWVRTRYFDFTDVRFVVDTGADCTGLPISLAEQEGIPFERSDLTGGMVSGLVGAVERFQGPLHIRMFGEEFDWPCYFLASPAATSLPSVGSQRRPYGVLGRAGFLAAFRICIDSKYLTIQRRLTHFPWWRRWLHSLASLRAAPHSPDVPL